MSLRFLRLICRALVGVVLFAQIAISAHACTTLPPDATTVGMAVAMAPVDRLGIVSNDPIRAALERQAVACADMAEAMDDPSANLCAEHCRHGDQSGQSASLTVPAALLNALYVMTAAPEPLMAPRAAAAADRTRARAASSPPHAILHCCFRI
ncbi:MAG: hypothetical protein ABIP61_09430 [Burkholderiaceae bacterium]